MEQQPVDRVDGQHQVDLANVVLAVARLLLHQPPKEGLVPEGVPTTQDLGEAALHVVGKLPAEPPSVAEIPVKVEWPEAGRQARERSVEEREPARCLLV